MNSLFISYASDDQAVALEVCALLEAQGVRCWIAPRDVTPGAKWDEALLHAIDQCGAFLLLLSAASNESPFVQNEVNRAFGKKKAIFTFRIEDITPSGSLEFYLARHHWTDGFAGPIAAGAAQLAAALIPLFGQSVDTAAEVGAVTTVRSAPHGAVKRRARFASARSRMLLAFAVGAVTTSTATGGVAWWLTRPAPLRVVRVSLQSPGAPPLAVQGADRDVAIAPDGSRIVYRGDGQLLVRALDQLRPTVLSTGGNVRFPFVSPDGQSVGYFDGTLIKKMAMTGGPALTVADAQGNPRGATWGEDGSIVFATSASDSGLLRVPAAGGDVVVLTRPSQQQGRGDDHIWPEFLPGGRAVLFTMTGEGAIDSAQIAVLDLETGAVKVLLRGGSHALYASTGHLVYGAAGTLRAVPFDLAALEVTGAPVPVLEGVMTAATGAANFAVARDGSLVFVEGTAGGASRMTVVAIGRDGRVSVLPGLPPDAYRDIRVSPDGLRVALATESDIWIYELARSTLTRLTTHPADETRPIWTPDGRRVIFRSWRAGYPQLFWRSADGSGEDEPFLSRDRDLLDLRGNGWMPDGSSLLVSEVTAAVHCRLTAVPAQRRSDAKVLLTNEFCNDFPAIAPDGRSVAYGSNVSGRNEVYVARLQDFSQRQQVSTDGGYWPTWSRDGRELFFSDGAGRDLLVASVRPGDVPAISRPQRLFELAVGAPATGRHPYDLSPDGRFMAIRAQQEGALGTAANAANVVLVQNWFEELKRVVGE